MKKYFILAAAALAFAACTSDEIVPVEQVQQAVDDGAVRFDAYVNRGTTRAGVGGTLTNANFTNHGTTWGAAGFGVFAYYTDGVPYGETSKPDFMYNQQVKINTSDNAWEYNPIKYWPNEFGNDAISEGQDKLTFFAYAPYVEVTPSTGRVTGDDKTGIVGMTSNTASGDPYIKYIADFDPAKSVDLCWGVAKTAFTSSVNGNNNTVDAGKPYIDVIKPKVADKINFDFKHALASLNVQIDADVDVESHATSALNKRTKIWVRSVTFEGFTNKGALNLHANSTEGPLWYELSSINNRLASGSITIYDGRRDGKEGQNNAEASNETPTINDVLIQGAAYDQSALEVVDPELKINSTYTGVPTGDAVNLFKSATETEPIFVIPTDENLKVKIVYDVETYDTNLAGFLSDGVTRGSSIENDITKEITIGSVPFSLEAGKAYTVKLHLGMTSVKFDASVTDWVATAADDTDLPINGRSFYLSPVNNAFASAAADETLTLNQGERMDGTKFDLGSGTTPISTSTITMTYNGIPAVDATASFAWSAANVLKITDANTTLYNKYYSVQLVKNDAGIDYPSNTITIMQPAGALTWTSAPTFSTATIDIGTNASAYPSANGSSTKDWRKATIKVSVAGDDYERVNASPTGKQFMINEDGTITLPAAPSGRVIIKVQAGDAAEATAFDDTI